jgi:hypothetical protein
VVITHLAGNVRRQSRSICPSDWGSPRARACATARLHQCRPWAPWCCAGAQLPSAVAGNVRPLCVREEASDARRDSGSDRGWGQASGGFQDAQRVQRDHLVRS